MVLFFIIKVDEYVEEVKQLCIPSSNLILLVKILRQ